MSENRSPAILFDLDGTLVDSVYQHVLSWHEALLAEGIDSRFGASTARSA
jgi:beta-phosphoglucomutase-like phosphatase (HAD superfamily)